MSSSQGRINISARSPKLPVDNRIVLWKYFRMADKLLKQADVLRKEKNVIDLYVMLLRFTSLVSDTIPCHQDYTALTDKEKLAVMVKKLNAVNELVELQPALKRKLDELDRKQATNKELQPAGKSSGTSITRQVKSQFRKLSIGTANQKGKADVPAQSNIIRQPPPQPPTESSSTDDREFDDKGYEDDDEDNCSADDVGWQWDEDDDAERCDDNLRQRSEQFIAKVLRGWRGRTVK